MIESSLYFGQVMHKRLRPFKHRFTYRVFSLLLDLDDIPNLAKKHGIFSFNKFNILSFHNKDHGPRDGSDLRPWLEAMADEQDIDLKDGKIYVLSFPRLFGYVFNPLTVYYCYDKNQDLTAIAYEVKNTFGGQHTYFLKNQHGKNSKAIEHGCDKIFYVSPFIEMDCAYHFRMKEPSEHLLVLIRQTMQQGEILLASLTGKKVDLTSANLLKAVLKFPLMSLKIMTAIHWEALWLWLKGAKFHKRPENHMAAE